jgi:hypothetical protein
MPRRYTISKPNTNKEQKSIWDKASIFIALASFFAAVAALVVSHNTEVISIKNSSAYVFPDLIPKYSTYDELNSMLTSNFKLTNFGQTPATKVRYKISYNFPMCPGYPTALAFSNEMYENFHSIYADEGSPAPNLSGQGSDNSFLAQFSNPHLNALDECQSKLKMLQVYVFISYNTIFGDRYRTGTLMHTAFFGSSGVNLYTSDTYISR